MEKNLFGEADRGPDALVIMTCSLVIVLTVLLDLLSLSITKLHSKTDRESLEAKWLLSDIGWCWCW